MTRRLVRRFRTTEGAVVSDPVPLSYSDQHTVDNKLDYIAWHMRMQTESAARTEAMLNAIGQTVTNIDGFCKAVNEALEEMRSRPNPMLKMMGMTPPGLVIPNGAQG